MRFIEINHIVYSSMIRTIGLLLDFIPFLEAITLLLQPRFFIRIAKLCKYILGELPHVFRLNGMFPGQKSHILSEFVRVNKFLDFRRVVDVAAELI